MGAPLPAEPSVSPPVATASLNLYAHFQWHIGDRHGSSVFRTL